MLEINKIYHGDCRELLKSIDDNSIDMVLTSPPYDNLRTYNETLEWSFEIFQDIAKELVRVLKESGVIVWVVADATINGSETGTSFRQALYFKELGLNLHDTMIWEKQTCTDTGSLQVRYGGCFEYMFIFSKGKLNTFNPIKDRKNLTFGKKKHGTVRQKDGSVRKQSSIGNITNNLGQRFNIWKVNTEVSNLLRQHPAQFPEQLAYDHIISWSNENDIILDPFVGSGTTCKVAYDLKRQYIGIEKVREYYDIACERLDIARSQLRLF